MFLDNFKVVWLAEDIDINSAGTNPSDGINMKNFHRCTFVVHYVDLGTKAHIVRVQSGATEGAYSSDLTFRYAISSAALSAANADVLAAAWQTSSALSVADSYDNYTMIVDIDASEMDVTNGEHWLNISFDDDGGGATGQAVVMAILEPRFPAEKSATCLS